MTSGGAVGAKTRIEPSSIRRQLDPSSCQRLDVVDARCPAEHHVRRTDVVTARSEEEAIAALGCQRRAGRDRGRFTDGGEGDDADESELLGHLASRGHRHRGAQLDAHVVQRVASHRDLIVGARRTAVDDRRADAALHRVEGHRDRLDAVDGDLLVVEHERGGLDVGVG